MQCSANRTHGHVQIMVFEHCLRDCTNDVSVYTCLSVYVHLDIDLTCYASAGAPALHAGCRGSRIACRHQGIHIIQVCWLRISSPCFSTMCYCESNDLKSGSQTCSFALGFLQATTTCMLQLNSQPRFHVTYPCVSCCL